MPSSEKIIKNLIVGFANEKKLELEESGSIWNTFLNNNRRMD